MKHLQEPSTIKPADRHRSQHQTRRFGNNPDHVELLPQFGYGQPEPRVNTLPRLFPKLEVGDVDDPAEHEADQAAEQALYGDKAILKKASTHDGISAPGAIADQITAEQGKGKSLYKSLQEKFAHSFGADFSSVKVHDNPSSHSLNRALGAKAFTVGSDMFFGKGQFAPGTVEGDRLIAHEAAHVVQGSEVVRRKIDPNTKPVAPTATETPMVETVDVPEAETPHEELDLPADVEQPDYFGLTNKERVGFHYTGSLGQHPTEPNADPKKNNYNYGVGPSGDLPLNTKVRVLGQNSEGLLFVYALTPNGLMKGWVSRELVTKIDKVTWEYTGNYIPGAKVRGQDAPNFAFVEDPKTQTDRMSLVKSVQRRQERRAQGYTESGDVVDGRYWFTKVYSFVTKREIEIMDKGNLHYPSLNMLAVLLFDKLYEDNLKRFDDTADHLMTDAHWEMAFENIAFNDKVINNRWWGLLTLNWPVALASIVGLPMYYAILSLVEGMIAHIRFDLPRALNYAFDEHLESMKATLRYEDKFTFFAGYPSYQQPTINDYLPDFMASTYVFEMAMQDMIQEMKKIFGVPVDKFPPKMMDIAMDGIFDADMNSERADTWMRAVSLSNLNESSPYKYSKEKGFEGDVTAKDKTTGLKSLVNGLKPDMEESRKVPGKWSIAGLIYKNSDNGQLEKLTTIDRIRMLREMTTKDVSSLLISTSIGDHTLETPIMKILEVSKNKGDQVATINGAGYWFIVETLGANNQNLRTFMEKHYLPEVDFFSAVAIINRAEMMKDEETVNFILKNHKDGPEIYAYYQTHVAPKP